MNKIRVLIGCETSQRVCLAFVAAGHEAYSCDLLPCRGTRPDLHFQMDVFECVAKHGPFDLAIFHPDCTYLTGAANRWLKDQPARKSGTLVGVERRVARIKALSFVIRLSELDIPRIAIENPIGCLSSLWRKPDQVIQPWMFGHPETKATCLWTKNLPKLVPTSIVSLPEDKREREKMFHLPQTPDRWQLRSDTYPGIAEAMTQWGM